jgi:hypothetical protein
MSIVLAVLVVVPASLAQVSTAGRLNGIVTDAQGAVVPNAHVTVKNIRTQEQLSAMTGEDGGWMVPSVAAGAYSVTVTATGFKTTVVNNVTVEVGRPTTVNALLEVGAVVDEVTVSSGGEVLQTSTSTVSSTLAGRQVNELPWATRDAFQLVLILPGTQTPGTPRSSSINGLPKGSLNITIDGINVQDNMLKSSDGFFTSTQAKADAISEVSLSTASPGAESSGQGAAQVRFVTKSGTNEWHGGVFWQHRNSALNSNYYFNNIDGLPRDVMKLNQAGGNLGGPIRRDKLFFFFNYEEFQLPQTYPAARTVLTDKARAGIYTYRDSAGVIRDINLYDLAAKQNPSLPTTVRPYPTTIDPTVSTLLSQFAEGTAKGGQLRSRIATNNDYNRLDFNFQVPGSNVRRFSALRLDWNVTDKHKLEYVYNFQYYNSDPDGVNGVLSVVPGTGMVLGNPTTGTIKRGVFSGAIALRSALSSRLVNEFRGTLGQGGTVLFSGEMSPGLFSARRGYTMTFPFTSNPQTRSTHSRRHTPVTTIYDNLTFAQGSHSWGFGATFTNIKSYQGSFGTQVIPGVTFGIAAGDPINTGATSIFTTTNFPGSTAAQRTEAWNLYAQLTGRVSNLARTASLDAQSKQYAFAPRQEENRHRELGFYVQDSWRARQSLTVNYGVRWEIDFAPRNTNETYTSAGFASVFGPSGLGNLFKPGQYANNTAPRFGLVNVDTKPYDTQYNDFAPTFGLAWTPNLAKNTLLKWVFGEGGQTVFRGGYSIAYVREGFNVFHSMWGSNTGSTLNLSLSPGTTPADFKSGNFSGAGSVLFRDASLPIVLPPSQTTFPIAYSPTTSFNEWDPNLQMGYVQSWTFGWQRELSKNMAIELRYVGNHGTKLWRQLNINEVNIFENGFLNEFRIAMENLRLARLANAASNNFGLQASVAGTRDIPIIRTALGTTNDVTFATQILRGQAGDLANGIATNVARMNNLINAGLVPFVTLPNGVRVSNFFQANPLTTGGSFLVTNGGHSTYNALQVELRRRLSNGLLVDGTYTWAKSLTNQFASSSAVVSQPRSLHFPDYDKGSSPWNIRHGFKINGIYELPVGPGRRFLSSIHGPVGKVLEGWQVAGVARIQSGTPLLLTSGRGTLNNQDSGIVLNNITTKELQKLIDIRKVTSADGRGIVYWLPQSIIDNSLAAFEVGGKTLANLDRNAPYLGPPTTPGQFGSRVFLFGPWQQRIDFNLLKRTRVTERVAVEFRAQFLNAFNMADFFIGGLGDTSTGGVGATFGQTRSAYRDITVSGTNDPGGRLIEFQLRIVF